MKNHMVWTVMGNISAETGGLREVAQNKLKIAQSRVFISLLLIGAAYFSILACQLSWGA